MNVARLLIADSERNADMLYASGMFTPDPFIVIELDGQSHGLFSPLEVGRAGKESTLDHVHLDKPWRDRAKDKGWQPGLAGVAAAFLDAHGVRNIHAPGQFALSHADQLRAWGFKVTAVEDDFFPARSIKSEAEIKLLARIESLTRRAMAQAERYLAECSVGRDNILRDAESGKRVKSADVRRRIETFIIARGAMPAHTIIACGRQGADPHNIGHGYIRAGRSIIIDIFPRSLASGYWGDMTRTFVKGKAGPEIKRLYRAVREGQDIGLSMAAAGVDGASIHNAITAHFEQLGFPTETRNGKQTGFFHGTGHGVGLDIHESPRISARSQILQAGQVVTIEPGLYYPSLGGVRLEDMVVVRHDGCDNLTNYRRRLEIP